MFPFYQPEQQAKLLTLRVNAERLYQEMLKLKQRRSMQVEQS